MRPVPIAHPNIARRLPCTDSTPRPSIIAAPCTPTSGWDVWWRRSITNCRRLSY